MLRKSLAARHRRLVKAAYLLSCLLLTSCQQMPFGPPQACTGGEDGCGAKAKVCDSPTVQALAQDLDKLERHIEKYGSVVAQHPDVWGQARLTRHREQYEQQMEAELSKFSFTLQGSLARSDQAYFADAFALSAAATAAAQSKSKSAGAAAATVVSNSTTHSPDSTSSSTTTATPTGSKLSNVVGVAGSTITSSTKLTKKAAPSSAPSQSDSSSGGGAKPPALPDQSDTFAGFDAITRTSTGTATGPTYAFEGNNALNVEPQVYLDQKSRYLNYLNELRRINEGDDTADSPGYALNLVRIPVSLLPGKCTEVGHGAEVTMTLTPHLNDELLPTTFRNLVLNDLVDQIAYPVTQFINNPDNAIYLDDRKSTGDLTYDVAELFRFADHDLGKMLLWMSGEPTNPKTTSNGEEFADWYNRKVEYLRSLRYKLTLQPLFRRPEWNWVDTILNAGRLQDEYENFLERTVPEPLKQDLNQFKAIKAKENRSQDELHQLGQFMQKTANYRTEYWGRVRDKVNSYRSSFYQNVLVPSTKSRRATLPFPPAQMVEVYGYDFTYQLAAEAYRGLSKERFSRPCSDSDGIYLHMPDVQGFLHEELAAAQKFLSSPNNCHLWNVYCTEDLATSVRSRQTERIKEIRSRFANDVAAIVKSGGPSDVSASVREVTVALAWATIVESALLTQQLIQDMRESASAKNCAMPFDGWLPYYLPNPPDVARRAFNEYVRCRWPIHVFALDPVTQQQNISDTFSSRREMQLSMSLAFVSGKISARNMMRYARRIEFDLATIDLNNTQVGFSHGDDTFGWRFYPRFQTPDIESNATVLFRDLLWGGPNRDALLRQRRLEPGMRECVAIVIMPSFVPYAELNVTSNWFSLTNPKHKVMDSEFAMRLSKSVKTLENCGPNVFDAHCYRDGDLVRLLQKTKQLSNRLPMQSTMVQIPYENTLGGFGMFNTGITDLAPELNGWYGSPSINPNQLTTIFLVGNHFSVHQTRVIAAGNEITTKEMLSRQVIKVVIPPFPNLVGNSGQKYVDINLATPYGVSQHLLVPVCVSPCVAPCNPQPAMPPGSQQLPMAPSQITVSDNATQPASSGSPPAPMSDNGPVISSSSSAPDTQPSPSSNQGPSSQTSPNGGTKKKS